MQADVQEVRCETGNHFKFYRAYAMYDQQAGEYRALFHWGRIGGKGQFQSHIASSLPQAQRLCSDKLQSKRRGSGSSVYLDYPAGSRHLDVVPEDLLEEARIERSANERSQDAARLEVDTFGAFAASADSLIRSVMGPGALNGQQVAARSTLQDQLANLRNRLEQAEGQMEVITEVIAMKASA